MCPKNCFAKEYEKLSRLQMKITVLVGSVTFPHICSGLGVAGRERG